MTMIDWRCPNGHVLGVVRRNGSNESQLVLYRYAIDLAVEEPREPEVLGILSGIGGMSNIQCSICGAVRDWNPDREAMRRLERRIRRRAIREAVARGWAPQQE